MARLYTRTGCPGGGREGERKRASERASGRSPSSGYIQLTLHENWLCIPRLDGLANGDEVLDRGRKHYYNPTYV